MTDRKARKSSPFCRLRTRNSRCPVSMLIVPKTTRRALRPEMGTSSGWPRRPHAARSSGNSNRSVSSSNSLTQRGGSRAICRRMRRFFVALGVGVEHVARPLPDIPQVVHLSADGRLGQALRAPAFQVLAQQRDGPGDRLVAEVLRPPLEAGSEGRLEFLGPQAGVIAPALIDHGGRVACLF